MSCNSGHLEFCDQIFALFFLLLFFFFCAVPQGIMMRKTQTSVTSTVLGMSPAVIFNLPDRCTEDAQTEMHLKTGDGEFSFYLSSNSGVRAGLFFPPPPPPNRLLA